MFRCLSCVSDVSPAVQDIWQRNTRRPDRPRWTVACCRFATLWFLLTWTEFRDLADFPVRISSKSSCFVSSRHDNPNSPDISYQRHTTYPIVRSPRHNRQAANECALPTKRRPHPSGGGLHQSSAEFITQLACSGSQRHLSEAIQQSQCVHNRHFDGKIVVINFATIWSNQHVQPFTTVELIHRTAAVQ